MSLPAPLPVDARRALAAECILLRGDADKRDDYVEIRKTLVNSMLRMLRGIANSIAERSKVSSDELLSEGTLAAMEAVDDWIPTGGRQIASWIRYRAFRRMLRVAGGDRNACSVEPCDVVEDRAGPEELAIAGERRDQVSDLLRFLPERERAVIDGHFGLTGEEKTFEQLGEEFGVSRQRVGQLMERAMLRLRSRAKTP